VGHCTKLVSKHNTRLPQLNPNVKAASAVQACNSSRHIVLVTKESAQRINASTIIHHTKHIIYIPITLPIGSVACHNFVQCMKPSHGNLLGQSDRNVSAPGIVQCRMYPCARTNCSHTNRTQCTAPSYTVRTLMSGYATADFPVIYVQLSIPQPDSKCIACHPPYETCTLLQYPF
jgi:hypothetical protein